MWGQCYSGSNNIHFNYPPIMEDGRNYASWQPEAVVNDRIRKKEGIKSNWEYRNFMINNGINIMNYNTLEYCYTLGLPCSENTNSTPASNVPFLYKSVFDTSIPGYGYCTSDLKNPYLTREELNARLISPSIAIPGQNQVSIVQPSEQNKVAFQPV